MGGLGNQLFQYSFARALSQKLNTSLYLDLSWFYIYKYRKYGMPFSLRFFRITYFRVHPIILPYIFLVRKLQYPRWAKKISALFLKNKKPFSIYSEEDFKHNVEPNGSNILLDGYFQDYKSFKMIEPTLRYELSLKKDLDSKNALILKEIKAVNSVSIHFRKGLYSSDSKIKSLYPEVSLQYYNKAVSEITKKNKDAVLFVFSNEINWVKENYKTDFPIFYISNDGPDYEHLFLMSQCNHNIITNSTFSWWAAWLNENPNKIVTAPKLWEKNHANIPQSWIRIEN